MGYITKVHEAICKNKLVIVVYFSITVGMSLHQSTLIESGIIFLFSGMILEDFYQQTIDMRAFLVLLILMACTKSLICFSSLFILGVILFRVIFLFTTKIKTNKVENISANLKTDIEQIERISCGYLPSLGISWFIYVFFVSTLDIPSIFIPTHEGIVFFRDLFIHNILASGIAFSILCLIWALGEYRLHQAKRGTNKIIYGFGDGDVFILGAFFAFIGFESFLIVFFLSLFIQAGWYLIYFLRGDFHDRR